MQEFLIDEKNGNIVDWKGHKSKSLELSEVYSRLGLENKALRVHQCGNYLGFKVFEDCTRKLDNAKFCQVRLCPMCAWRRSLKIFGQVSKVMNYIEINNDFRYIFVTLTVRNVIGDALKDEMDSLFKAFNLLTKRKEFKAISKGWFRCLEVTHNWKRNDYHPHFHLVVAVPKGYFNTHSTYLTHSDWVALWKSCLGVDYEPKVNVKAVKQNRDGSYGKAVAEVAKYSAKPSDYLLSLNDLERSVESIFDLEDVENYIDSRTAEAVSYMDMALYNRRLIAFGGLFKEVHKQLNLDDAVDGDLIHTDNDEEIREDLNYIIVTYRWNPGYKDYTMIQ